MYCGRWVLKRTALVPIVREEADLLPHRDILYIIFVLGNLSVFSTCSCMGGWVNFIFGFGGGTDIFVPGRAVYEPRLPLYRGYPLLLLPAAGQPHKKRSPRPAWMQCTPGRLSAFLFMLHAPAFLGCISLNTYLANCKFTHYRSFVVSSEYSASILYLHRSRLRL